MDNRETTTEGITFELPRDIKDQPAFCHDQRMLIVRALRFIEFLIKDDSFFVVFSLASGSGVATTGNENNKASEMIILNNCIFILFNFKSNFHSVFINKDHGQ